MRMLLGTTSPLPSFLFPLSLSLFLYLSSLFLSSLWRCFAVSFSCACLFLFVDVFLCARTRLRVVCVGFMICCHACGFVVHKVKLDCPAAFLEPKRGKQKKQKNKKNTHTHTHTHTHCKTTHHTHLRLILEKLVAIRKRVRQRIKACLVGEESRWAFQRCKTKKEKEKKKERI